MFWILLAVLAAAESPGVPVQRPLPTAVEGAVSLETMWGEPLMEVQRRLNRLGYDTGPLKGVAGVRTSAALREFQSCNGLEPHGRLDRSTRSLLSLSDDDVYVRAAPRGVRELQGVDPPSVASIPRDFAGSDPLDLSSMPTPGDATEPLDVYRVSPEYARGADWVAAVSRDECRKRPANPLP